jgi:hypothetical protein
MIISYFQAFFILVQEFSLFIQKAERDGDLETEKIVNQVTFRQTSERREKKKKELKNTDITSSALTEWWCR